MATRINTNGVHEIQLADGSWVVAIALINSSGAAAIGQAAASASMPVVGASDWNPAVIGNVASGATDSGNPVKVGGKYNATLPTITDGQRGDLQLSQRGLVQVTPAAAIAAADGSSNTLNGLQDGSATGRAILSAIELFNGSTWDRWRVSTTFKVVALSADTAEATIWTPTSSKKFRLIRAVLTASAQTILTFKDNTGGSTIAVVELAANVPFTLDLGPNGILSAAANNVLTVTRGTSAILNGTLEGCEE